MMHSWLRRSLVVAALVLLLCLPAPAQDAEPRAEETPVPPPSPRADEGAEGIDVPALVESGRFEEAIVALRPLLRQEAVDANALFLYGLASVGASQRPDRTDEERDVLLDEAIAAFHTMLVQRPEMVRVRLELARAFYLKGEDELAQRHFEHVLAGGVPQPVVANVQGFLAAIRRPAIAGASAWASALAPDTNIGAASEERTIYIPMSSASPCRSSGTPTS